MNSLLNGALRRKLSSPDIYWPSRAKVSAARAREAELEIQGYLWNAQNALNRAVNRSRENDDLRGVNGPIRPEELTARIVAVREALNAILL